MDGIIIFAILTIVIISLILSEKIKNIREENNRMRSSLTQSESKYRLLEQKHIELSKAHEEILIKERYLKQLSEQIKRQKENLQEEIIDKINKYLLDRKEAYKFLAGMMSDYLTIAETECIKVLDKSYSMRNFERKIRINDLKSEKKRLIEENKILKYELEYIQTLLPEANDIAEYDEIGENYEAEDWIYKYLPKKEYDLLPDIEKNKKALEYYLKRNKTNWEIGRDFERFVGYLWEKEGHKVEYYGIEKKLSDLGRDLIIETDKSIFVVQCKYWSMKKQIHEKHIAQLFGTLTKYKLDHPDEKKSIVGLFVTHTTLSDEAKRFAEALNIIIQENVELGEYPIIKCNIGRDMDGFKTRIYHLPMDQQYDKIIINKNKGDFYAFTIEEAEKAGFRRAWKWHGNS
jgi:hypothetical protein